MAVDGTGVPPRTSRLEKSVWVFSFDFGPRSVEAGALEALEAEREVLRKGEEREVIGVTKGRDEATRQRLELVTARLRVLSCIGGIAICVGLHSASKCLQ